MPRTNRSQPPIIVQLLHRVLGTVAIAATLGIVPRFLDAQESPTAPLDGAHLPSLATDSPAGWITRFERAYESRALAEYAALLTTDFRFHFGDDENRAKSPDGWGREDELISAGHLFEGFVNDQGVEMPAAVGIELDPGKTTIEGDPLHPDDPRFAVIRAPGVNLTVHVGASGYFVDQDCHTFWVVRGDAAFLGPDQAADPDHWYLRRWVETPDHEVALLDAVARTNTGVGQTADRVWTVSPNPVPKGRGTSFVYDVPPGGGEVDIALYSAAGRRVAVLATGVQDAGVHRARWDGQDEVGRPIAAGVYFVRARVVNSERTARVVVAE